MFFLDMSIRNESFEGLLSGYTVKCLPRDQEVGGSILARRSEILRPYLTFREVYGMCAYELIHKSTSKLSFRMLMSKKHFFYYRSIRLASARTGQSSRSRRLRCLLNDSIRNRNSECFIRVVKQNVFTLIWTLSPRK